MGLAGLLGVGLGTASGLAGWMLAGAAPVSAADGEKLLDRAADRPVDRVLLAAALNHIDEQFLEPVDLERLALDGLAGLSRLDPAVSFSRAGGVLGVTVAGQGIGEFTLPVRRRPSDWADFAARVAESVRLRSPALTAAGTEAVHKAVIDGMTADLDGSSRYTTPEQAKAERSVRDGYVGIGVTVRREAERLMIADVIPDGPADRAGIRPGEALLAVDGVSIDGLEVEAVATRLAGRAGSPVQVTVGPPTATARQGRRLSLRRDRVVPRTVTAEVQDGVGIIRIERFNAATLVNLSDAIRQLKDRLGRQGRGYVLDLRGNPGGLLDQAVAVADRFVTDGTIVSTEGRHPDSLQHYDARSDDQLSGAPLVVLVDGRSASAAEVVAAALQDSGRAAVVGASSYGKGSVQTVIPLPNQGELFLTWSRIHAPSGYTLHKQGVQPSLCTSREGATAAGIVEELRSGGTIPTSTIALWQDQALSDPAALAQLRAACPKREHEPALDLEVAKALLADPALYRRALARSHRAVAAR